LTWGKLRSKRKLRKGKMQWLLPRGEQLHGLKTISETKHLVSTGREFRLQELTQAASDQADFATCLARWFRKFKKQSSFRES
jgi:hypothetical protein